MSHKKEDYADMKEERVGKQQRNGRAHVKADVDDEKLHTCSLYASQRRLDREPMHRWSPPPIYSLSVAPLALLQSLG